MISAFKTVLICICKCIEKTVKQICCNHNHWRVLKYCRSFNNKLIPLVDEILVDSSNNLLEYLLWDSFIQEEGQMSKVADQWGQQCLLVYWKRFCAKCCFDKISSGTQILWTDLNPRVVVNKTCLVFLLNFQWLCLCKDYFQLHCSFCYHK